MQTPKISVLISNFNNGHFIEDCVNSLTCQSEIDWEAVIIDDCSTDNSFEIINLITAGDPRFRIYRNDQNIGYQRSTVRAIELARANFFARLDPDDALVPEAIQSVLTTHADFPNVGLVYSNLIICDTHLHPLYTHKAKQVTSVPSSEYFNFDTEISHFACFKKKIYDRTSGIDIFNKRAEDKDIFMKMCEVAPVKHIDQDLYLYRNHRNGISTSSADHAVFWHWVALIKMSERTGVDVEDLFVQHYTRKELTDRVKKAKWAKIGHVLGLFKAYKGM